MGCEIEKRILFHFDESIPFFIFINFVKKCRKFVDEKNPMDLTEVHSADIPLIGLHKSIIVLKDVHLKHKLNR